ncbi:unnamed protein product [Adineta steineri]|uniref:SCP domain-containing protein n=1 Tax=Adineta steineri TaxID=433720 RepID=A0A818Y2E0_9BILA|nr:unnamed protein product [Adineta steineri]
MLFRWISFFIIVSYLIIHINAKASNETQVTTSNSTTNATKVTPPHNDTSRDKEGEDHDSEPFKNGGSGTHEANSQNIAAETNGTHGISIDQFQEMILHEHNVHRLNNCANALQEDEDLHTKAMERAHSLANGKPMELPNEYNENMYESKTGDPSNITCATIVETWFNQSTKYDPAKEDSALQFTQLVWKNSKKLGVGHAYNGQTLYVIVLYQPSGNLKGQFAANVGCGSNGQLKKANR